MSEVESEGWEEIAAYHDGELRGLARWRFEWRLRRSPRLRRELESLHRLGDLVRASEARASEPDLWDRIQQRLPALDARRADEAQPSGLLAPWLLRPLGAVAVVTAALLAVYAGVFRGPSPSGGVVRWMDSGGRPVMVLEGDAETQMTIIWMLDDAAEGAARGGPRDMV
jgi:hypothetical protein